MKIEIENYINRNYYELLKVAKKYTKNDDWASELLHEVILQLYDSQSLKVKLEDKDIKYYIVRALMVNWCYPTSPFFRKHKALNHKLVDIEDVKNITVEEFNIDEHQLMDILEIEWSDLDVMNKMIFEKYLVLGSLKKVSKDTSIPLASVGRYVKETKETILKNTIKKLNN